MSTQATTATSEPTFPYPGLRAFTPKESHLFFGRDKHVFEMFSLLENHRFLAVVGASGSGKSSLVQAGLLPRLQDEGLINQRDGRWRFLVMRPGNSPLDALANACHQPDSVTGTPLTQGALHSGDPVMTRVVLESGPKGLVRILADARVPDDDNILLLVDQFEELFRFAGPDGPTDSVSILSRNESLQFVALLLETARQTERPVHVVLTMRTDFIGHCDEFDGLPQAINAGQFLVPRLSWRQLGLAITAPLQQPGFSGQIDPAVVDHMLNAASRERDALPLVQHVLLRMWLAASEPEVPSLSDGQEGKNYTLSGQAEHLPHTTRHITENEHYWPIGGLARALDRHASTLYEDLTPEQQRIAARLFRCLGKRDSNGLLTRRLTSVQEVADIVEVEPSEVSEVVNVFRQSGVDFLVTRPDDLLTATAKIDISHESLLRQWKQLQQWIEEESEDEAEYRRLIHAVDQGEEVIDDGIRLDRFVEWRERVKPTPAWARRYDGLVEAEKDLLARCLQLIENSLTARRKKREKAERDRLEREQEQKQVQVEIARAMMLWRMLLVAGLATVVSFGFAVVAYNARNDARKAFEELEIKSTENQASAFMAGLSGPSRYPTIYEYGFLNLLAESGEKTQFALMKQLLQSPGKAERLRLRYPYVLQAVIGLDIQVKERIKRLVSDYGKKMSKDKAINTAIAELGVLLADNDADFNKIIAMNFVAAMEKTTDSEDLSVLSEGLGSLGGQLRGEQSLVLARQLVAAMEKTTGSEALSFLGEGLGSLGEQLPEEQALAGARQLVVAMERTSDPSVLFSLGNGLGSLGEQLPEEQALAGARQLVVVIERTLDSTALSSLGKGLGSLGGQLRGEQALALAKRIVAVMERTLDSTALSSLGEGLGSLGEQLRGKNVLALVKQVVAAMEKTVEPDTLSSLGQELGRLAQKLSGEQVLALAKQLVAVMEKTLDPSALSSLSEGLGNLGERLPGEQALAGAKRIVAVMEKTPDPSVLSFLGKGLGSLGEKLPGEQALAGAKRIVAIMENTLDTYALTSLGEGLESLGEKLEGEQALALAKQIVAIMENTPRTYALPSLGKGLESLGEKLEGEQALALAKQIVAAIEKTVEPDTLSSLGKGLGSLGEKLPGEQALAGARQLVVAMEKAVDPFALSVLGEGLGNLGEKLPGEQALAGAKKIVAAMERVVDPFVLSSLGNGLSSLGEKLPGREALALAKQLVAAMERTVEPDTLSSLGKGLGSLGEKLPGEQASVGAKQIVATMERVVNPYDLSFLGNGLGSLGKKLPVEQASAGAKRLVAVMEKTSDPYDLSSLGNGLESLRENLSEEQALAGAKKLVAAMGKTVDPTALSSLGKVLAALVLRIEIKDTASVLKSMICVGATRKKVLAGLEKKTGQMFDGNLWKAVAWLEEKEVDVMNVPRFRISSQE